MTDSYTDKLDKRSLSLLRLAQAMIRDTANPALEAAYKAARSAAYELDDAPTTQTAFNKMMREMVKAYDEAIQQALEPLTDEMNQVAVSEATWTYALMTKYVPDVSFAELAEDKVIKYAQSSMLSMTGGGVKQAFTWSDYIDRYFSEVSSRVKNAINGVWLQGVQSGNLPSLRQYTSAVQTLTNGVNKRDLESLIRTGVTSFSTNGRLAFRDDNLDVIEREVPVVTFDNRTSDICISVAANYGEKGWKVGKSPVGYPPYHPQCRTGISFTALGQSIDGMRQAVEAGDKDAFEARRSKLDAKNKEIMDAREAVANGSTDPNLIKLSKQSTKSQVTRRGNNDEALIGKEIAASTPIAKYLRSQPDWFIKDTLGATRGQAFIDGKLDLRTLTTDKLKPKTLAELNLEEV